MQVGGIELPGCLQPLPIFDDDRPLAQPDQAILPEPFQASVHMHGGQAGGVGQFGLRERQAVLSPVCEPDSPEADV
jgi:hypothetical protein